MCHYCNKGHFIDNRTSVVLQRDKVNIVIHNVACFFCPNCHKILLVDKVVSELQNSLGVKLTLLTPDSAEAVAA